MSVDPDRGIVYVPTGSASPDFYGGKRLGRQPLRQLAARARCDDGQAAVGTSSSSITICGTTTSPRNPRSWRWSGAAQPLPAVIQATKTGMLFVFDRDDRQAAVPGAGTRSAASATCPAKQAWPTQPFSSLPPLVEHRPLTEQDAWGLTFWDRGKCRDMIRQLPQRRRLHASGHARHDHLAEQHRRRELGRHRVRPAPPARDRRRESPRHGRHAHRAGGRGAGSAHPGDYPRSEFALQQRRALRHAPRAAALAVGPAVHGAAVGHAGERGSARQPHRLAGAARLHGKPHAVVRAGAEFRHAEPRRARSSPPAISCSSAPPWTGIFAPSTSKPAANCGSIRSRRVARPRR